MTILIDATFATSPVGGIAVTVSRHCRTSDDEPSWVVTVKDSTNVVLLRKFTSIREAFGFTGEALAGLVV
jgi:hypothetical protein